MEPVIIDLLRSHRSRLTEEEAQMFSCFWLVQRMYIEFFLNTQDWDSGRVIVEDWDGLARSERKLGPFSFVRGS